ncbi:hypothetical protein TNCV_3349821 [Trichonephila clavipes]|nr:hypothetical protein TNCV_3349821 [Trichonephila clavipes]
MSESPPPSHPQPRPSTSTTLLAERSSKPSPATHATPPQHIPPRKGPFCCPNSIPRGRGYRVVLRPLRAEGWRTRDHFQNSMRQRGLIGRTASARVQSHKWSASTYRKEQLHSMSSTRERSMDICSWLLPLDEKLYLAPSASEGVLRDEFKSQDSMFRGRFVRFNCSKLFPSFLARRRRSISLFCHILSKNLQTIRRRLHTAAFKARGRIVCVPLNRGKSSFCARDRVFWTRQISTSLFLVDFSFLSSH